jgi:hypothetical protein
VEKKGVYMVRRVKTANVMSTRGDVDNGVNINIENCSKPGKDIEI